MYIFLISQVSCERVTKYRLSSFQQGASHDTALCITQNTGLVNLCKNRMQISKQHVNNNNIAQTIKQQVSLYMKLMSEYKIQYQKALESSMDVNYQQLGVQYRVCVMRDFILVNCLQPIRINLKGSTIQCSHIGNESTS